MLGIALGAGLGGLLILVVLVSCTVALTVRTVKRRRKRVVHNIGEINVISIHLEITFHP